MINRRNTIKGLVASCFGFLGIQKFHGKDNKSKPADEKSKDPCTVQILGIKKSPDELDHYDGRIYYHVLVDDNYYCFREQMISIDPNEMNIDLFNFLDKKSVSPFHKDGDSDVIAVTSIYYDYKKIINGVKLFATGVPGWHPTLGPTLDICKELGGKIEIKCDTLFNCYSCSKLFTKDQAIAQQGICDECRGKVVANVS